MSDDIVTRLNAAYECLIRADCLECGSHLSRDCECSCHDHPWLDAVDEIERLREKVQDLQMYLEQDACEIERLRTLVDQWHQERMQLFGQINLLEEELTDAYDACRYALANSSGWEALAETVVHTWEVNHGRQ